MFAINRFACENLTAGCVTDEKTPRFSFAVSGSGEGDVLGRAEISVNGWTAEVSGQTGIVYAGEALKPETAYTARLRAVSAAGETAEAETAFRTGKFGEPWQAHWITDGEYRFTEKKTSPVPMLFRKKFETGKKIAGAYIHATAVGIYELTLNGSRVGEDYFSPGFTSYKHTLQYQTYDVTGLIGTKNTLLAAVAGGWAVGAFVMTRRNRITADRQAFLAELRLVYEDGSEEIIGTDADWEVTGDGPLRFAEFYDGEVYDATAEESGMRWRPAARETLKIRPDLVAAYGAPVRAHEVFRPVSAVRVGNGDIVYDFGQNFAGVVRFTLNGRKGQTVVVRHAEILDDSGRLNTAFLRSAKCMVTYTCREGMQTYSPTMTYMGFRYVSVSGIDMENIGIEAVALYSDMKQSGTFECSDARINRLQKNIEWSGKSNFVDIPTDCPQRDERMGWTGDIAVFASTACWNFDMRRFLDKWMRDVRDEQIRGGGIPPTVPAQGYGFPATMPRKAIAFWGDACVFVPWAEYLAYGDEDCLRKNYRTMKKYVKACKFWANIGIGKRRYIWNDLPFFQFGDWVAPDVPSMGQWQARCKWTGTAALAASSGILARIAEILGEKEDAEYYRNLKKKVSRAYSAVLTDGKGKLKNEFQTAYVLPLYFDMFSGEEKQAAADNLATLVEKNGYRIGTGFPGTPYILFALADNGHADTAFRMLMNTECPSWLYEVEAGATTIWERWDAMSKDGKTASGQDGTGGMVSFNHYAFGAVGDFLYRRVLGVEAEAGGYRTFRVRPLPGGGLTWAKGSVETPYGTIACGWEIRGEEFSLRLAVPSGTHCSLSLPCGETHELGCGEYSFSGKIREE